ncbi:MAG TPA: hypothetical protein VJZ00_00240 [Thermoanaerobaculia bacterium]|nr:hypothetical protein [Thermoanaerobaculia bacterium]
MFSKLELAIILAGAAQLAVAASSLLIPRMLEWQSETALLKPLTRQVFWTYAVYIFGTNVAFGLLSLLAPKSLLDGSTLARAVCSFIALYWLGRVAVQFAVYDRSVTVRPLFRVAEAMYLAAFVYLGVVYSIAAVRR